MINQALLKVCKKIEEWCGARNIPFDWVCDETDLQGIMLFKKSMDVVRGMLKHADPYIAEGNIHVETRKVRGGIIVALSLESLSESTMNDIIAEAGEELEEMGFKDTINNIFNPIIRETEDVKPPPPSKKARLPRRFPSIKSLLTRNESAQYEDRLAMALEVDAVKFRPKFNSALNEALDGIATADGVQPKELFQQFARALRVLGDRMGIGPLQDRLKEQGITWKQSDDGQAVILTIKNATTGADQPISRISYETLQNPGDFETALKDMMDFASGEAPGAFAQKEQEIQDRKKTIGDIARAVQPKDPNQQDNGISQAMQIAPAAPAPAPAAAPAAPAKAAPKVPAVPAAKAQAGAPAAAATTAAKPK